MKDLIKAIFSHGEGVHRESGLDNLFMFMDDRTYVEVDCGA